MSETEQAIEQQKTEQGRITVYWGVEKISPVQYNSFEFGGFHYTTNIRDDETPEEAFNRAYNFLDKMAREAFANKSRSFRQRLMDSREGY